MVIQYQIEFCKDKDHTALRSANVTMANTNDFDIDDPRYRITPTQQMFCSCIGALATSTLGNKIIYCYVSNNVGLIAFTFVG